jgi:hypothetical protein
MLTRWSGEPEEERRDIRMELACHNDGYTGEESRSERRRFHRRRSNAACIHGPVNMAMLTPETLEQRNWGHWGDWAASLPAVRRVCLIGTDCATDRTSTSAIFCRQFISLLCLPRSRRAHDKRWIKVRLEPSAGVVCAGSGGRMLVGSRRPIGGSPRR